MTRLGRGRTRTRATSAASTCASEANGNTPRREPRAASREPRAANRSFPRSPLIPSLTVISSLAVHLRYRRLKTRCERRILVRLVHNQRILANLSRNSLFWRSSPANSVLRSDPLAHLPGSPPTSPRSRSPCSPLIIPRKRSLRSQVHQDCGDDQEHANDDSADAVADERGGGGSVRRGDVSGRRLRSAGGAGVRQAEDDDVEVRGRAKRAWANRATQNALRKWLF